jgi:Spy/CpxP family protein refolding chaperone
MRKIATLAPASVYAAFASSLSEKGFTPIHPKQVNHNPRGFQHQDLTNTASQPIKSSHNSKQRKKSKRNRKGRARDGGG